MSTKNTKQIAGIKWCLGLAARAERVEALNQQRPFDKLRANGWKGLDSTKLRHY